MGGPVDPGPGSVVGAVMRAVHVDALGPDTRGGKIRLSFACFVEFHERDPRASLPSGWVAGFPESAVVTLGNDPKEYVVPVPVALALTILERGEDPADAEAWREANTRIARGAAELAEQERDEP